MTIKKNKFIPYHNILDELQIAFLPIVQQLPIVQSMLKWAHAISIKESPSQMGWMFANNGQWSAEDQVKAITSLSQSVEHLKESINNASSYLDKFKQHQSIHIALEKILSSYKKIPTIAPELRLLREGHALLDNLDTIVHLIEYTNALTTLQANSSELKEAVIKEVIDHLSLSLHPVEEKSEATEE